VLPLFAGIYRMGAGLGPATAFLYSGPAINALAIILTARILGLKLGLARAIGAILFSIIIGLLMNLFFRKEESDRQKQQLISSADSDNQPLYQTALYFAAMLAILIFANWSHPPESVGFWNLVYSAKWIIVAICALLFALILHFWFALKWWKISLAAVPAVILAFVFPHQPVVPFAAAILGLGVITAADKGDCGEWFDQTWIFAKQIMPLLLGGILVAGFLLGRPGNEGIIPSSWVVGAVGGNSLWANLFASVAGAFMYFATLTEIPILQGLIGGGMGQGPALALLLAGPALSLPSMLVIRSIMGTKKTLIFILLVIVMSTAIGLIYGTLA